MKLLRNIFLYLVLPSFLFMGCNKNTLYFHETAKLGFNAELTPDAQQPVNTHLGFKRRLVSVVPPKLPYSVDDPSGEEKANEKRKADADKEKLHKGEALSLVSLFKVRAKAIEGVEIYNNFATGIAAKNLANLAKKKEEGLLKAKKELATAEESLKEAKKEEQEAKEKADKAETRADDAKAKAKKAIEEKDEAEENVVRLTGESAKADKEKENAPSDAVKAGNAASAKAKLDNARNEEKAAVKNAAEKKAVEDKAVSDSKMAKTVRKTAEENVKKKNKELTKAKAKVEEADDAVSRVAKLIRKLVSPLEKMLGEKVVDVLKDNGFSNDEQKELFENLKEKKIAKVIEILAIKIADEEERSKILEMLQKK